MSRLLGGGLVVEITPNVVKRYQADRLNEKEIERQRQAEMVSQTLVVQ